MQTPGPRDHLAGCTTLAMALHRRAVRHPERLAVCQPFAEDPDLSYADLDARVQAMAVRLRRLAPAGDGDRFAVIVLPNGADYVTAFLGCLAAGVVAVPLYPPSVATARAVLAFTARLGGVVADCAPFAVLAHEDLIAEHADLLPPQVHHVDPRILDPQALDGSERGCLPAIDTMDVSMTDRTAMLQYTSGSTSDPKGVQLTHGNLLANVEALARRLGTRDGEHIATWLPLYHDMGLIGAVLQPLWAGMTVHLFTPSGFVRRPADWLRLVSRHHTTIMMAPNFAYELCLRRGRPEAGERLDLSSVRYALNGAEPVRPSTVAAFTSVFGEHGFPSDALTPAYGLAENTVGVSFGPPGAPVFPARRSCLVQGTWVPVGDGTVGDGPPDRTDRVDLVGCGTDLETVTTAVVDPATGKELPPGAVGEIWVNGPSVARGYHGHPEETETRFRARLAGRAGTWLRTGDLGVRVEGRLCICGRIKDLIIDHGANHDPADIEATSAAADPRTAETAAVFSVAREQGSEQTVLLQEVARITEQDARTLMTAIRADVAESHGLRLDSLSLVPRGQLPKTTSGKVQRGRARAMWLSGELTLLVTEDTAAPATALTETRS